MQLFLLSLLTACLSSPYAANHDLTERGLSVKGLKLKY
jgi:hypothetical protein